jgi:transcriptional regulator with XRE-family HTH domain
MKIDINKNIFEQIEIMCENRGISVSDLCRLSGVHRMTVEKWKRTPKTISVLKKLLQALPEKTKGIDTPTNKNNAAK